MHKKLVVIGLLGTTLDQASRRKGKDRWSRWRPSVATCQQSDLVVDRMELLFDRKTAALAGEVSRDIALVSPETEVRSHSLVMDDPWDFESVYSMLHSFASDYEFDTDREDYLVHITTGSHVAQICLFLLTESRHLPGNLLQTSPAASPNPKSKAPADPTGRYRIIDLDLSKYDHLATRFREEHRESQSLLKDGIQTKDEHFNRLIERIERVTIATESPILLSGPTGAGKTQLAKRIYQLKRKRELVSGELVEINCATIRGDQAMSTLFGHRIGAFTGATTDRAGLLLAADGGVLFLDEIGELGSDEQAMLLRAIEDKTFTPVGSDKPSQSNFQLIAGTNRNLTDEVAAGRFREDLLARINLWSFELPGLADRRADIDPNLDFELARYAKESGKSIRLNKEARTKFLSFALDPSTQWKGNFRDLNAAVIRMATLSTSGRIGIDAVEDEIERLKRNWGPKQSVLKSRAVLESVLTKTQIDKLDRFDQVQLADVIQVCRDSKSLSDAGRKLFQVSRRAKQKVNDSDRLRKYLLKFEMTWDQVSHPV